MPQALHYLVIVTYGRTGSTALQAAANAHPHVVIRGENYQMLRGARSYLQSIAETASRHHAGRPDHPWYGSARLDPVAVRADLRDHIIRTVLRPRGDTEWLGFKEIRFTSAHWPDADTLLEYLMFISTLLPGVRYLFNIRDAQDAMRSAWWRREPDALGILTTTQAWLRQANDQLQAIVGTDRAQLVDYAAWAKDPAVIGDALGALTFPAQQSIIAQALGEHLSHGRAT